MGRLKRKIDNYLIEWKNSPNKLPLIIKGANKLEKLNQLDISQKIIMKVLLKLTLFYQNNLKVYLIMDLK